MQNKYVLAMYDVRGKQEFIFRTNKLQEIVGASWLIRDVFDDYLYESAKKAGGKIYNYKKERNKSNFSLKSFKEHMRNGYIGEVVYEGGGNFLLIFENENIFKNVTYHFTKSITENIGTLHVLGTCVEITNFDDFPNKEKELYAAHRINEAQESNISPWSCLPIVQVDRKTSQPLIDFKYPKDFPEEYKKAIEKKGVKGKLSKESAAKLIKYYTEKQKIKEKKSEKLSDVEIEFYGKNEDLLDNLVTEKGVDSQLAIVYIDGNNMGAQVQEATKDKKSYEEAINALRDFSEKTQRLYVEGGIKAALQDLHGSNEKDAFRIVVSAGDEINFIVNAHDAFKCAQNYLEYIYKKDNRPSACAGIAVFHSHAPYADVYKIAEEACESGKQKMKEIELKISKEEIDDSDEEKKKERNKRINAIKHSSFIDFHICQGAIGTSLDEIRKEENEEKISRPWKIVPHNYIYKEDGITDYETMVVPKLKFIKKFARSNIKGLISAAKEGIVPLQMEINRMYGHAITEDKQKWKEEYDAIIDELKEGQKSDSEKSNIVRLIIYDIALAYDLWFADKGERK